MNQLQRVTVLKDRCSGCQECLVRCPERAISLDELTYTVQVDEALCVGCRQCERTCPFSAIKVEGPLRIPERTRSHMLKSRDVIADLHEVRVGFFSDKELIAEANRCLACPDPTCVRGCPAHNDIPTFIERARNLDFAGARDVLLATSSMPEICARVCDTGTQCEGACSLALAGEMPVAVHEIERYLAERSEPSTRRANPIGLSVAVIGGGPAGIGVADVIARGGGKVTIFEAEPQIGGLLRTGIPEFTLPDRVVSRVARQLEELGVEIVTGTKVPLQALSDLSDIYDAVVLAEGASASMGISATGKEQVAITQASTFLSRAHELIGESKRGETLLSSPRDVLVVGAGNTAMDVARMTRRLGGRATCVDWMDRRFSLVRPDELEDAEYEGVEVLFSVTVSTLAPLANGKIEATLVATVQEVRTARPEVTAKVFRVMEVDEVVAALGYRLESDLVATFPELPIRKTVPMIRDRHWLASGIFNGVSNEVSRNLPVGELSYGRERVRSRAPISFGNGVYVVGDALCGPSTVVEAMAQGRAVGRSLLERCSRLAPSRVGRLRAPRILVSVDSPGGTTRSFVLQVAEQLSFVSREITVLPVDQVTPELVSNYDLLVLATWVDGFVVGGQHAGRATERLVDQLMPGTGVQVGVVMTYGVDPGHALERLKHAISDRGLMVVAGVTVKSKSKEAFAVARELCDVAWPVSDANTLVEAFLKHDILADDVVAAIGLRPQLANEVTTWIGEMRSLEPANHELGKLTEAINGLRRVVDDLRKGSTKRSERTYHRITVNAQ